MPYNALPQKLEVALFSVISGLQASIPEVLIVRGISQSELAEPCCICECQGGDGEAILDTGNFTLRARITVRTSPDETGLPVGIAQSSAHETRVGTIFDALMDDGIAATLSAAVSDFYVFDVTFDSLTQEIRERGWGSVLSLSVVCCGSDVG